MIMPKIYYDEPIKNDRLEGFQLLYSIFNCIYASVFSGASVANIAL